jgi:fructose-specific phosphotransferase system component IIB
MSNAGSRIVAITSCMSGEAMTCAGAAELVAALGLMQKRTAFNFRLR